MTNYNTTLVSENFQLAKILKNTFETTLQKYLISQEKIFLKWMITL